MLLENKVINFLGDSITLGCGISYVDNRFSSLIEKRCGLKRANNYGIGWTRIARQKNRIAPYDNQDFCNRCTQMDNEADIIVVMGGINDHAHGDAPLGMSSDRTPDTFYGACHYLMRTLLETYPSAVIVICTPTHYLYENELRGIGDKKEDVALFSEYIKIIRDTAEYYSLPLLDLWKNSGLQPAVPAIGEKYFVDGIHPNDAGHMVLADRIIGFLTAL